MSHAVRVGLWLDAFFIGAGRLGQGVRMHMLVLMSVTVVMVVMAMIVAAIAMIMRVLVQMFVFVVGLARSFPEGNSANHDQRRQGNPGPEQKDVKLVRQHQIQDLVLTVP